MTRRGILPLTAVVTFAAGLLIGVHAPVRGVAAGGAESIPEVHATNIVRSQLTIHQPRDGEIVRGDRFPIVVHAENFPAAKDLTISVRVSMDGVTFASEPVAVTTR